MPISSSSPARHSWKIHRLGGLDQVLVETGADLLALDQLDQKLWVALSCPVKGLFLDEKTLALLDSDADGRIRVPEILAAIKWAALHLRDVGDLLKASDTIPLNAINTDTPDGRGTLASARAILEGLGKPAATAVSLAEAADTVRIFSTTKLNGDGVVTPASTDDPALAQLIRDILATTGGTPDRSGSPGVATSSVDAFYSAASAFTTWSAQGQTPEVQPFAGQTAPAASALRAVRAKIDDFFGRTRVATFDARAIAALNKSEADFLAIAAQDLTITVDEMKGFPLARVEPGRPLPLAEGLNPAWAAAIEAFRATAVTLAFGPGQTELTAAQWTDLKARFAAHEAWVAAKAGAPVESLGVPRLREILDAPLREPLAALIAADKAVEPQFNSIHGVERLARYQRDFRALLENFVNFTAFYSPDRLAVFQAGTLYLDSRSTELCLQVTGPSPLAAMSKAYIAYCDCRRAGAAPQKIAACFTQGDSDYLFVGRNGVFYDRQGRDWDATITAIAENPISIRQAFWLPYKKFVRKIEETVAKRAAAAEAESDKRIAAAAEKTASVDTLKPIPPAPGAPKKVDVGTVAAIGVAATAAVSTITLLLGYLLKLDAWQYPLVLLGFVVVISGPSMLIAWLKLRQRTLGPILEACSWAINGRVKINVPFGSRLTDRAVLPPGARRILDDPYATDAKARRKALYWTLAILLALTTGAAAWFRTWPFAP